MPILGTTSSALTSIVIPLAIVLAIAGVLLAVLSVVRRRMKVESGHATDFTLTELRDLRAQGKLTEEEFERAKSLMVGKVHAKLAKEARPSNAAAPLGAELKDESARPDRR